MKIHIISDIHREFSDFLIPDVDADVLVIAGDLGETLTESMTWLGMTAPRLPIIVVAGNHDFWGASLDTEIPMAKEFAPKNVHILDGDALIIDGVRFVGGTLWTDYVAMGEHREYAARRAAQSDMNDFLHIGAERKTRGATPLDLLAEHNRQLHAIETILRTPFSGPTVVVTHHSPTVRSLPDGGALRLLECSYASRLDPLIMDTQPEIWVHGHIHDRMDYLIGETRILCNPRGYQGERKKQETGFDPLFVVELPSPSLDLLPPEPGDLDANGVDLVLEYARDRAYLNDVLAGLGLPDRDALIRRLIARRLITKV